MNDNKHMERILKECEKQGWVVKSGKRGHVLCLPPNKEFGPLTLSRSVNTPGILARQKNRLIQAGAKL